MSIQISKTKNSKRKKWEKIKQKMQEMWNNYKQCSIYKMEISGEEREKGEENTCNNI